MNERWCPYPGCQDARTLLRGQLFCPYHWLVYSNGSPELVAEVNRIMNFRARCAGEENDDMTTKQRQEIAKAAKARWAKMRAEAGKKNGATTKPGAAPLQEEPIAQKHPLAGMSWTLEVDHAQMRPSETNPRTIFSEEGLQELAASLKGQGQLQNLVVRVDPVWAKAESAKKNGGTAARKEALLWIAGVLTHGARPKTVDSAIADVANDPDTQFEIVVGERRWRAAGPKYAALKKLRAVVVCMTDEEKIRAQYAENDKRKDLSPLEEAAFFTKLVTSGQYSVIQLADKLGKSREYVYEKMKIARLEGPARKALAEGTIPVSVAAAIATVPDKAVQERIFKEIVFDYDDVVRPVRDIDQEIQAQFVRPLSKAGWKMEDAFTYAGAVHASCAMCPKNTRNMTDVDANLAKGPARCLNVECFEARENAAIRVLTAKAKAEGLKIVQAPKYGGSGNGDFFFEGRETRIAGNYQKPEKKLGSIPHTAVAVDGNRLIRVWEREALEKEGKLKVDKQEERSRNVNDEYKRDRRKFELLKEEALHRLVNCVRGTDLNPDVAKAEEAVLRSMFLGSHHYDREEREAIPKMSRADLFEFAVKEMMDTWYRDEKDVTPTCLEVLGIRMDMLRDCAKQRFQEEQRAEREAKDAKTIAKAKSAKPVQKDFGEFLDRVTTKPDVSAFGHVNGAAATANNL